MKNFVSRTSVFLDAAINQVWFWLTQSSPDSHWPEAGCIGNGIPIEDLLCVFVAFFPMMVYLLLSMT